jgi:galactokinase
MKEALLKIFQQKFITTLTPLVTKAPGRVNIIGEHTDYNEGFVLPAAINKAAYFAIALSNDNTISLYAADLNQFFSITTNEIQPQQNSKWVNYILGVVQQFKKYGINVKGFNAVLKSDVPIGAGLSSSAAVECAVAVALNALLQTNLDEITIIKMAQKAEHEYAGVQCGIMDQFASIMSKKNHLLKLDCRLNNYEYVPLKLEGYKILLLNTNVKHNLANSEYNTRKNECNEAVTLIQKHLPQIKSLRDVTINMLEKYVLPINKLIYNRALYVLQENERLLVACTDLANGNIKALGNKMFATHEGLKNLYEVSCKELDFLIGFVKTKPSVVGARMMGGGFGGCTINIVKEESIDELIKEIEPAYKKYIGLNLSYYIAVLEDGACVL